MPILPFGEYRPDVADYEGQHTKYALNVYPRGDGYGPVAALQAYSSAAAAACRGFFVARKNDGTVAVFMGTSTKLYILSNTTLGWSDVSRGSSTYTTLATNAQWQFRQFNNYVFAVQGNDNPQVYDLTSSTNFADLGGSPPQAAYISIVNRFVVLSGIASPNVYRVQWSGLNAATTWTSGVSQSDYQDLADGGIVRGVAGGELGVIFQDQAIRRMTYAPGSPYVFGIDRIATDDGLLAPYSLISAQDRLFYLSPQGFKMLLPGQYPTPIGKEKVDRTFFADADLNSVQLIIGANDPRSTRVYWAYKSINGATGLFDKMLCYDWALDKWSLVSTVGEFITSLAQPGITLEGVDAAYGSSIDALTISSLDDISSAAYTKLSAFNSDHKLGFFAGSNLEATIQSSEHGADGRRIFVRGFRPVCDAAIIYGCITSRDNAQSSPTTTTESLVDGIGQIQQRKETRYARAQIRIPAGTTWNYAAGVEPDAEPTGTR